VKASTGVFAIINLCESWQWFRNLKFLMKVAFLQGGKIISHQVIAEMLSKNIILGLTVANAMDSR
jgi:hypothetical protein